MDMRAAGYEVGSLPNSPEALMVQLLAQGCYDEKHPIDPAKAWRLPRPRYAQWFHSQSNGFQQSLCGMWGEPSGAGPTIAPPFWRGNKQSARRSPLLALNEPYTDDEDYLFSGLKFGNVFVAIQPPRGFGVDPEAVYHATDLPPCHHYAAFYRWLADEWRADAIIHFGTHGTLEWLPGKSLALSADCAPDALLGDMPLLYPFVVNNPGEGAQAKRRTHAVIVDHLVPPLTHADTYGPLATLARLVEEYYRAEVLDTHKLPVLRRQIWDLVRTARLEDDLSRSGSSGTAITSTPGMSASASREYRARWSECRDGDLRIYWRISTPIYAIWAGRKSAGACTCSARRPRVPRSWTCSSPSCAAPTAMSRP